MAEPSDSKKFGSYLVGAPIISVLVIVMAGLALGASVLMYFHDGTSAPLVGAIGLLLGKFSTVVDFFLGDSSASQTKDGLIAGQLASSSSTDKPANP